MLYRILIIEDSDEMQLAVSQALKQECDCTIAKSNREARALLEKAEFDLVLLDLTLPDGDGFKICNFVRQTESLKGLPIIFLTGRAEIEDKEMAFSIGADDYLVKPLTGRELKARVLGRVRRERSKVEGSFSIGNIRLNFSMQTAVVSDPGGEKALETTPLEFKVLSYFSRNEDHILSRDQILTAVWGENVHLLERTVDAHISHIRKKLQRAGADYTIQPVHGFGYKFCANKKSKKSA